MAQTIYKIKRTERAKLIDYSNIIIYFRIYFSYYLKLVPSFKAYGLCTQPTLASLCAKEHRKKSHSNLVLPLL